MRKYEGTGTAKRLNYWRTTI